MLPSDFVTDSKRISAKKIRTDMISRPQNDLRHTGHIGYDGAIFGDVGFIGDNYDKLPVKVGSSGMYLRRVQIRGAIIFLLLTQNICWHSKECIRESPPQFDNRIMAQVYVMSIMHSIMYQNAPFC